MTENMTLTLAAWSDWIWIALVGATVIGSMIGNIKKKSEEQRKRDEGPGDLEIEELAARRREQLRQASRNRAQVGQGVDTSAGMSGGTSGGVFGGALGEDEPGNLTMAERIARARAKAQYEQRARAQGRPPSQAQVPNEAQRRALAQRQAELERRRQAARAQQEAQQRARLQAQQQAQARARQQQAQAQAQAHARAQAQARRRGTLLHEPVIVSEPTESTARRRVPDRPARRATPEPRSTVSTGSVAASLKAGLSRDELRRAIVLNEVLGKPISMRED